MNVFLVDREEEILRSVDGCGWKASGKIGEHSIGPEVGRGYDAGLENGSGEFVVLILVERFGSGWGWWAGCNLVGW